MLPPQPQQEGGNSSPPQCTPMETEEIEEGNQSNYCSATQSPIIATRSSARANSPPPQKQKLQHEKEFLEYPTYYGSKTRLQPVKVNALTRNFEETVKVLATQETITSTHITTLAGNVCDMFQELCEIHNSNVEKINQEISSMSSALIGAKGLYQGQGKKLVYLEEFLGEFVESLAQSETALDKIETKVSTMDNNFARYSEANNVRVKQLEQKQQQQRTVVQNPTYADVIATHPEPQYAPAPQVVGTTAHQPLLMNPPTTVGMPAYENMRVQSAHLSKPLDIADYGSWSGNIVEENFETQVKMLRTGIVTNRVEPLGDEAILGVMHTKWCISENAKQVFTRLRESGVNTFVDMISGLRKHYLNNEYARRTLDSSLRSLKLKRGTTVDEHFTRLSTLLDNRGIQAESDRWTHLMNTLPDHVQAELIKLVPDDENRTLDRAREIIKILQASASVQAGAFTHPSVLYTHEISSSTHAAAARYMQPVQPSRPTVWQAPRSSNERPRLGMQIREFSNGRVSIDGKDKDTRKFACNRCGATDHFGLDCKAKGVTVKISTAAGGLRGKPYGSNSGGIRSKVWALQERHMPHQGAYNVQKGTKFANAHVNRMNTSQGAPPNRRSNAQGGAQPTAGSGTGAYTYNDLRRIYKSCKNCGDKTHATPDCIAVEYVGILPE